MFDFPAAPATGAEYTSGGVTYVYTGTTWDLASGGALTDYVLKTGDTMTGALTVIGNGTSGVVQLRQSNNASNAVGCLEFFAMDGVTRRGLIGYGDASFLDLATQGGSKWKVQGGLHMSNCGLHWGTDSAVTSVTDFSEGICLYGIGSTSQFGLNVTSGTLNLTAQNTANLIAFNIGSEQVMNVKSDGLRIPGGNLWFNGTDDAWTDAIWFTGGGGNPNRGVFSQHSTFTGYNSEDATFNFTTSQGGYGWSLHTRFQPGSLFAQRNCSAESFTTRCLAADKSDMRDLTDAEVTTAFAALHPRRYRINNIDPVDQDGNPLPSLPQPKLSWGFVADEIYAHPATKEIATVDLHGELQGAEAMQIVAVCVAKIKQLEAEIATLRPQPRGRRGG